MNKRRIPWLTAMLLGGLLIGLPAAGQKNNEAEVLLQAAAQKAAVDGNLQEAIRLCQQILAEHPDNRPAAAKALVQIGECYEKLGKDEARKAYEQVLSKYADQSDQVRLARARLAALGSLAAGESGVATRRVWAESKTDFFGAVSPDGKYLSFVDWETGDLTVRDLQTGTNRRLTNKGSWEANPNEEAGGSIWSPDSRQVAYQWNQWSTKSSGYELRLLSLDNPTPRSLYRCSSPEEYIVPFDWSPDGKNILGAIHNENAGQRLVLVSVADGTVRALKKLSSMGGTAAISPDGRYVLYDYPQSESSLAHDIFLLPIAGGKEAPVVEYPADDRVLGWAPDGKWALYASDRRGSVDVWAVRLEEGKAQGAPVMVKPAVGRIEPLGLTRNGSFYYGVGGSRNDVYVVKMDPGTGDVLVPPTKLVKNFEGYNGGPQYSPDGKYLAYVSYRLKTGMSWAAGTGWGDTLCILMLATGEEREYQREMTRLGVRMVCRPCWSPDGRSVLLFGQDSMGRYGIYHLNLETGKTASILRFGENLDVGPLAGWRDAKSFIYRRVNKKNDRGEVCVRALDTGDEQVLYSVVPKAMGAQAVSPDGRWLSALDRSESDGKVLRIISTASGEVRQLFKFSQKDVPGFIRHAWSADSKHVLYTRRVGSGVSFKFEVWRVPIDGGPPQKTGLEMPGAIDYISAHPDGAHLAFENMAPMSASPAEVWVIENFLPKTK